MYYQLKSFISAAELKSVSSAARKLFLTQPAVSQHIRFLEDQFGVKLMRRSGNFMELTPEGKRLYDESKGAVKKMDDLKLLFSDMELKEKTLRFSTIDSFTLSVLPAVIKKLLSKDKNLNFMPKMEASALAISELQNESIDVALCTIDDLPAGIAGEALFKEKMVLIGAKKYAGVKSIRSLLAEQLVLFPKTSKTRQLIDKALIENGIPPISHMETMNVSTIVAFVEAGMGISMIPQYVVYNDLKSGRVVEIPLKKSPARTVGAAYKKGKRLSSLAIQFIRLLREESKKL